MRQRHPPTDAPQGLFYVGTVAPSQVPILGAVAAVNGKEAGQWEYQVRIECNLV